MANVIHPPDQSSIKLAVDFLRAGKIICFPTETVYGIGCAADNDDAIKKLFALKSRSQNKPLQVMVKDIVAAQKLAEFDAVALNLARSFLPGPLTLVLNQKRNAKFSALVAGGETVGIRIPDHRIIQDILGLYDKPLAVTSVNISGEEPARTAKEAAENISGLEMIIDGGPAKLGVGSTVVDLTTTPARILREGSIPRAEIERHITTATLH